jgi:RecB family endonuclease NucS
MNREKNEQKPQKPVSGFPQNRFERYEECVRSSMDLILTTNEVSKMRKAYLEKFIVRHSELIGRDLTLYCRRTYTPEGAFDLWFENRDKDITIVELKLKRIGKGELDNLRGCMHFLRKTSTRKNICGIVVCKNVSPTIVDELKKQQDIRVFCFGWKLLVYPKHWD